MNGKVIYFSNDTLLERYSILPFVFFLVLHAWFVCKRQAVCGLQQFFYDTFIAALLMERRVDLFADNFVTVQTNASAITNMVNRDVDSSLTKPSWGLRLILKSKELLEQWVSNVAI